MHIHFFLRATNGGKHAASIIAYRAERLRVVTHIMRPAAALVVLLDLGVGLLGGRHGLWGWIAACAVVPLGSNGPTAAEAVVYKGAMAIASCCSPSSRSYPPLRYRKGNQRGKGITRLAGIGGGDGADLNFLLLVYCVHVFVSKRGETTRPPLLSTHLLYYYLFFFNYLFVGLFLSSLSFGFFWETWWEGGRDEKGV